MHLIIDGLIILLIAFVAFLSAKKGFVCTVIEVAGFIAVMIFINFVTLPISNTIYDKVIEPSVKSTIENAIEFDTIDFNSIDDNAINISNIDNVVNDALNKLPAAITQNNNFEFSIEEITTKITEQNVKNRSELADVISKNIIKPTVINAISLIVQIILLTVLFILVKILAKLVNKLFSFSVIGSINKFLGGVLGIAKGVMISALVCLVINLILSITTSNLLIFTPEAINSTYIFKMFINFSPFI